MEAVKLEQSSEDCGTEAEDQVPYIRQLYPESEGETETELPSQELKFKSPHAPSE